MRGLEPAQLVAAQRVAGWLRPAWVEVDLSAITANVVHIRAAVAPSAVEPSTAEVRPLWEAGVGVIAGAIADYPGSDHYRVRGLPIPYFIYRGDFFRADQSGTRLRAGSGKSGQGKTSGKNRAAWHGASFSLQLSNSLRSCRPSLFRAARCG